MSIKEKERLYQLRMQGKALSEIAEEMDYSLACVRKWYRRIRDEGIQGMHTRRQGRKPEAPLVSFPEPVRQEALRLKQQHQGWGARRVRVELQQKSDLAGMKLPSASCLAVYFRRVCPEQVQSRSKNSRAMEGHSQAKTVHQVWQLDFQERILLGDGDIVTVCNLRDPFAAAMIASQVFSVKAGGKIRKLQLREVCQVLREAFQEWGTLPDSLQTDHESLLAGSPADFYPSPFTCWLVGLGIQHLLSRPKRPTDQAQVERNHRTLQEWTFSPEDLAHRTAFQLALQRERTTHNAFFPSRASDCAGTPPLEAHPQLLQPRRPFDLHSEGALFDPQRIVAFLAGFTFQRKVTVSGQLRFGGQLYWIGRKWIGKLISITLDPDTEQWSLRLLSEADGYPELRRVDLIGLDFASLTGMETPEQPPAFPVQLSFPCSV
jgi:transposase InsO family protein